jgi:hypothetical protein
MKHYGEKIEYDAEAGVYYAEVGGEYIEEARLTDIKSDGMRTSRQRW